MDIVRNSDDTSERREAIIALGYEKDSEIYELLMDQLQDPATSIRHAAVISLGRYGNAEAIDCLVKPKILRSPVDKIRWAAVIALGHLGDHGVIDYLVKAAGDPDWIVRNQAVTELKSQIRLIIEAKDHRRVRILLRLLAMDDEEIVELATEGLLESGTVSRPLLREALKSPSSLMRQNAAKALGMMRAAETVDPLIALLSDSKWQVRRSAVEALGLIKDKAAVEPLVRCLSDNVEVVQRQACQSLVRFGPLATEAVLTALAHEKSKFVMRAMINTLGEIGDPKGVGALVRHLRSSYYVVRLAAAKALVRFGSDVIEELIPTLSFNQSDISGLLKDAVRYDDPKRQLRAIKALSGLEENRAVPVLRDLVEKGSQDVQDAAAQAVFHISCAAWSRCGALTVLKVVGSRKLIPCFIRSLNDDSDDVRLEAVKALAEINGPKVISPLIEAARNDQDEAVRFEAVRHLRTIGVGYPNVLELGLSALTDSSINVRAQAAWLLGNFQDSASIKPLLKATADPHWSVRESAEIALHNFGSQVIPYLIEALRSRSWTTRLRAARLLGGMGDKSAVEPLKLLARKKGGNAEVREVALKSLARLEAKLDV